MGVNSIAYQIERARKLAKEEGLSDLAGFPNCDFLHVDAPDESFDAVYSIGATCYASDIQRVYGEIFRLLKPGGPFGSYEWCMTELYDSRDSDHVRIKEVIELGNGMLNIDEIQTIDKALESVGFEILKTRDIAAPKGPSIPGYQPLVGSGIFLAAFRSSTIGRFITHNLLRILEALRIAPKGAVEVSKMLNDCAITLAEAGLLGISTPMYAVFARKPK